MSRVCELTGKKPMVGNTVSHSNIKTKRRYLPNLVNVTVHSDAMGQSYSARVSAAALRTVDKRGGLDGYLAKAKDEQLSPKMLKVKKEIAKRAEKGICDRMECHIGVAMPCQPLIMINLNATQPEVFARCELVNIKTQCRSRNEPR